MKKLTAGHVILAAAASLGSDPAGALGFGRVMPDAVLGQTLQFTVPVHVEDGEHFGAECASTEVYFGDVRLNPAQVRQSVERGSSDNDWVLKISTLVPIEEPVVEVAVSAGCERRFTRRFTAFADPPELAATRVAQATPATVAPAAATPLPAQAAGRGAASRGSRAGGGATAASAATPAPRHVVRKGPTQALATDLANRPPAAPRRGASARHDVASAAVPEGGARLVLDSGYARLKLDMEEPVIPPAGAAAPAGGASIALGELDDPAVQQLRALQQSIEQLKRDSQASRDQTARLRGDLADAQARSDLLPWALGLLGLAVAGLVVLVLRLRQQQRIAHSAWFNESQLGATPVAVAPIAAAPEPTAPVPPRLDDALPETDHQEAGDTLPPPYDREAFADMSATRPIDRATLSQMQAAPAPLAEEPHELSVEELLDLEQQADFFIALGQEDAAVDLLMSHLRSAGGQSPLPYTKLLEIYRRQGDRSAYERTRARFNRRFNAYAPDWDIGPGAGRTLEDYPETIAYVQAVWPSPIDAMAALEAMLFKRDERSELFDLPAYRDVLLLYSLARDLWQMGGGLSGTQVDVLLPIGDAAEPAGGPGYAGLPPLMGLDLPLDEEHGGPATFEMTGFEPPGGRREIDLPVPLGVEPERDAGVHATLDEFSLEPAEPVKGPSAPDWDLDDETPPPSGKR